MFDAVLLYEPLIPSLFLFLVGLSLTRSLARAHDTLSWYARQARRAVILWLISAIFFALEHGIRLPDMLTASGILATIAYAILLVGGLLILRRKTAALAAALATGTAIFVWLYIMEAPIFALTAGNSPFLPLWLFAIAGALCGLFPRKALAGISVVTVILSAWIAYRNGLHELFTKPFGRSDAARVLPAPITGGDPLSMNYYNLRPTLALFCASIHVAALSVAGPLLQQLRETVARIAFALGRHALGAYILHLALLAVIVVLGGPRPLGAPWQGTLVFFGVLVICWIWAMYRERQVLLRRKQ
jgi:hypothetical protein